MGTLATGGQSIVYQTTRWARSGRTAGSRARGPGELAHFNAVRAPLYHLDESEACLVSLERPPYRRVAKSSGRKKEWLTGTFSCWGVDAMSFAPE